MPEAEVDGSGAVMLLGGHGVDMGFLGVGMGFLFPPIFFPMAQASSLSSFQR